MRYVLTLSTTSDELIFIHFLHIYDFVSGRLQEEASAPVSLTVCYQRKKMKVAEDNNNESIVCSDNKKKYKKIMDKIVTTVKFINSINVYSVLFVSYGATSYKQNNYK